MTDIMNLTQVILLALMLICVTTFIVGFHITYNITFTSVSLSLFFIGLNIYVLKIAWKEYITEKNK